MQLTTTAYAILGHLALQPWTMYDLARQMRRNVNYYLPRAESRLYEEPKRLVALGLASARTEMTGRRARTIYAITPAGMAVLRDWLATPAAPPPALEFEAILRVVLAPFGNDADLRTVLVGVREQIGEMIDTADAIRADYVRGTAPFQRYMLHRSIMHDFLCSFAELVDDWAARSIDRMDRWPTQDEAERLREALEEYRTKPTPGRRGYRRPPG